MELPLGLPNGFFREKSHGVGGREGKGREGGRREWKGREVLQLTVGPKSRAWRSYGP